MAEKARASGHVPEVGAENKRDPTIGMYGGLPNPVTVGK